MSERRAEVLLAAVIIARSTSFVFNKIGLRTMDAFNMLSVRFLLAFVLLAALFGRKLIKGLNRRAVAGGALVGFLFFLVMSCEMLALKTVNAGTVSLLENLAIILVPLLESALHRKAPSAMSLLCAAIAVGGVALLTLEGGSFRLGAGECIALLAAFLYAAGIIAIGARMPLVAFNVNLDCATIFGATLLHERVAGLGYLGIVLILGSILLPNLLALRGKSRARAVLFDMDGTLLDTLEDLQDSVNHVLLAHGYPARTREEIRAFLGNGAAMLLRRALPDTVGEEEFAALLTEYKAWYQAHNCIKTHPYPGIPELLDKLRKSGVQVAIVSNKPDPTTKALAEKFFPGVPAFGQRDDLPPKPAPDLVLCALKELGCPRESAIYVGDSEVDIQTAWNCRMNYIGVSWGFRGREKLLAVAPRAIVVDRAEEILQGKNLQFVH